MIVEYAGGRKLIARHRGLEVLSDQPEQGGGENTALTPTALFVASVAMCAAVFIVNFAERHDIALEGMSIETEYEMAEGPRRVGGFRLQVNMPGPLDQRQRAALLRVAEQCVVHQTLVHQPHVEISIA